MDRAAEEQRLSRELGQLQVRHEEAEKELRISVNEPTAYGLDAAHSWFIDNAVVADRTAMGAAAGAVFGDLSVAGAEQRLARYGQEVRRDLLKNGNRAQQIRAIIRERGRQEDEGVHRRKVR